MNKRSQMLENEKISTLLLKLSLPATVGMIVNALYNIIDTIFIGQGVGKLGIAGLTISWPIQIATMAFSLMIGIGAASAVSRSLGAKDVERADYVAGNAFLSITIISIFITTFGLLFLEPMLKLFGATDSILPYAKDYMSVILIGTLYFPFVMTSNNLVRAEGNAKASMMIMIIGTGLNIILDPILIFDKLTLGPISIPAFGLGIKGAALATILSQFISLLYLLRYLYGGNSSLKVKPHHLKPNFEILREIVTVGFPSFIRNFAGSLVALVVNNLLKIYGGETAIAILGITNRVLMFLFMPLFGVIQGMQPIAGFNYGAKKYERVRETVKLSIITTITLATIGTAFGMLFPERILTLFTKDKELIIEGSKVLRIIICMIPIVGVSIVGASLFQALGKAIPSLLLALLRQVLLLIPLLLILPRLFPESYRIFGVWVSYPIADLLSTIVTGFLLKRELNHLEDKI